MLACTPAGQLIIAGRLQALLHEVLHVQSCCRCARVPCRPFCSVSHGDTVGAQQQQRLLKVPAPIGPQDQETSPHDLRDPFKHCYPRQGIPIPAGVQKQPGSADVLGLLVSRIQTQTLDASQACGNHKTPQITQHDRARATQAAQETSSSGLRSFNTRFFSSLPRNDKVQQQQQQAVPSNEHLRGHLISQVGAVTTWRCHQQSGLHGQPLALTAAEQHQQQKPLKMVLAADEEGVSAVNDQHNTQAAQQPVQQHCAQQSHEQHQQQSSSIEHHMQDFASIGVAPELVQVLHQELQITVPTPVQVQAMQPVAGGRHVAVQSATGTGKTLAYLLPLMSTIKPWDTGNRKLRHGKVVVLAPTQELCMQIVRTARSLIPADRQAVMPLVGGSNFIKAVQSLNKHKPWLIVATPGRLCAVANVPGLLKKALPYTHRGANEGGGMTLVLEEAPKLLAMDDTKQALANLAPNTAGSKDMSAMARILRHFQVILVSASLKPSTLTAAPAWSEADPVMITAPAPPDGLTLRTHGANHNTSAAPGAPGKPQMLPSTISHQVLTYDHKQTRMEKVLLKCLKHCKRQGQKVLVFVGDKGRLAQIEQRLSLEASRSLKVCCVHGRLPPYKKADLIRRFNRGQLDALLLTDGFALGLDFEGVDVVMQVGSLPASLSQYTHRAGRCGRMGRQGTVVSLVPSDRLEQLQQMIKRLDVQIEEFNILIKQSDSLAAAA